MNQTDMFKQMMQFNKNLFENSFNAITLLQDQTEKAVQSFWDQNTFLPKEGKNLMDEWTRVCKTGRESFKSHADEAFNKVETFMAGSSRD